MMMVSEIGIGLLRVRTKDAGRFTLVWALRELNWGLQVKIQQLKANLLKTYYVQILFGRLDEHFIFAYFVHICNT